MPWWKDNPDLYRYYRDLDRKYDERRRKLDMDLLRTRSDLAATTARLAATERSQQRARHRQDAERERDWIEREFRHCAHFEQEACEQWADRTAQIGRVAADDAAHTRQLLADFRAATEGYQCDLHDLITGLGGRPLANPRPHTPFDQLLIDLGFSASGVGSIPSDGPPPGSIGLSLPDLGPSVNLRWLRAQIGTCRQLREETRRRWLAELPPTRPRGSIGFDDPPMSTLQELRRTVTLEARYAASQADLLCSSLELLQTYIRGYTA